MILKFHEDLRFLFPESIEIEASTPMDALKLIAVQHPLNGKIEPVPVKIKQLHSLELAADPTLAGAQRVYDIVPAELIAQPVGYAGAGGSNGIVNVIVGVVLIAVAVFAPPALVAAGTVAGAGTFAAGTLGGFLVSASFAIGVNLVLTGMMQLLAPNQEDDTEGNRVSRLFGSKTTTEIGTPIPMIFGRHLTFFHLYSFNVDARDYDGIDDPDNSPYFKGKTDELLPTINKDKFYGYLKAGDTVYFNQTDNEVYRTGREF